MAEIPFLKALEHLDTIERQFAAMRAIRDVLDAARRAEHAVAEAQGRVRALEATIAERQAALGALDGTLAARMAETDTAAEKHRQDVLANVLLQRDNAMAEVEQVRAEVVIQQKRLADAKRDFERLQTTQRTSQAAAAEEWDRTRLEHTRIVDGLREEANQLRAELAALRQDHRAMIEAAQAIIGKK